MKTLIHTILILASLLLFGCESYHPDAYIESVKVPDYYKANTLSIKSASRSSSAVYLGNGYLLTCAHCIHQDDNNIRVNYKDEILIAKVVKYNKKHDLALLKVDKSAINLNSIVIAKREPFKYETLHAIGYFHGIPNMLRVRTIKFVGSLYETNHYEGNVVKGFSGGPIFNSSGELVAVSFYKHWTFDGQKDQKIVISFTNKIVREFLEIATVMRGLR